MSQELDDLLSRWLPCGDVARAAADTDVDLLALAVRAMLDEGI